MSLQNIDDAIQLCKKWELDNFSIIYDAFVQKIYNFCYNKTFDTELTEDLVSEIFFKLLKSIEKFPWNTERELSARIYRMAYNLVIDNYRSKKSEKVDLEDIENTISYNEDYSWKIDNDNKIQEILDYLEDLPKNQKDVIIMRFWDDLPYKEISEITWLSLDNCKKIVSRNLWKLKETISIILLVILFTL